MRTGAVNRSVFGARHGSRARRLRAPGGSANSGKRAGDLTDMAEKLKALEGENRELYSSADRATDAIASARQRIEQKAKTTAPKSAIGFLIGWSAEREGQSAAVKVPAPLPGGLTSRARCIIGAWSVSHVA